MPSGTPNVVARPRQDLGVVVPELHAARDARLIHEQRLELVPGLGRGRRGHRARHALAGLHLGEQRAQLTRVEAVRLCHVGDELLDLRAQRPELVRRRLRVGSAPRSTVPEPGRPTARRHARISRRITAPPVDDDGNAAGARRDRLADAFQVAWTAASAMPDLEMRAPTITRGNDDNSISGVMAMLSSSLKLSGRSLTCRLQHRQRHARSFGCAREHEHGILRRGAFRPRRPDRRTTPLTVFAAAGASLRRLRRGRLAAHPRPGFGDARTAARAPARNREAPGRPAAPNSGWRVA